MQKQALENSAARAPAGLQRQTFRIKRPSSASPDYNAVDLNAEIARAEFVLVGAGAGLSVDSGLKTFRDIARIPQYQNRGLTYDDICQPYWLLRDYRLFFGFWGSCYNQYMDSQPHSGYTNLVQCLKRRYKDFFVYTSNIDGFFARMLNESELYEVHGYMRYWQCSAPCCDRLYCFDEAFRFSVDCEMQCTNSQADDCYYQDVEGQRTIIVRTSNLPRCKYCHMLLRPHVLMFNDYHYIEEDVKDRAFRRLKQRIADKKVLIIELGCGLKVPHVRQQMELVLRRNKRYSVMLRVNPGEPGMQKATRQTESKLRLRHIKQGAEEFLSYLAQSGVEKEAVVEDAK